MVGGWRESRTLCGRRDGVLGIGQLGLCVIVAIFLCESTDRIGEIIQQKRPRTYGCSMPHVVRLKPKLGPPTTSLPCSVLRSCNRDISFLVSTQSSQHNYCVTERITLQPAERYICSTDDHFPPTTTSKLKPSKLNSHPHDSTIFRMIDCATVPFFGRAKSTRAESTGRSR